MATFTEERIRARARRSTAYASVTAAAILNEHIRTAPTTRTYDVFLSHSVRDAEVVLGVKLILEDNNRSVYVDWLEDPQLDRSRVNAATAERIRLRMRSCRSLVYLHTENSGTSTWMPWELGFFDGFRGAVAILPVTRSAQQDFRGQEYLGIYPWIDEGALTLSTQGLRVHRAASDYKDWRSWVETPQSFRKTA
ncbi:MAG TPA: hypothetical protein VF592_00405 [Sphingomonas sp.]|jgi:hypothetical protein|uniref:hypothetical protein n=1 Tax=Sphingomonas sp. TaxID=28214 RepID=UPI002ED886FF